MLAVWRKAALYDPARAGPATWIFTIARNLCLNVLRRRARHPAEHGLSEAERAARLREHFARATENEYVSAKSAAVGPGHAARAARLPIAATLSATRLMPMPSSSTVKRSR